MNLPLPGRTLFLLAVIVGVLWLGYAARAVVTPLLAALLLAYVLDPVVRRLERMGLSRSAASGLVVALAFATIVGGSVVAATRLVQEATHFYHDVVGEPAREAPNEDDARRLLAADLVRPDAQDPGRKEYPLLTTQWEGRTLWYADQDGDGAFRPGFAREGFAKIRSDLAENPMTAKLADNLHPAADLGSLVATSAGRWLAALADAGNSAAGTAVALLTLVVLFPIYLYYSLARLSWVYDVTVRHLPAAHRDRVVDILGKIHATLSAFFRGRLILLVLRFLVLLIVFVSFGVPFAGVCAAFSAVASLVPVFGPVAGAAVPLLLSMSSGSTTASTIGLLAAIVVVEVVEQYALTPAVVGKRVGLHPLTILVATFVAGDLLGIFGMLVAIPLTAVLKILAIEFVLPEVRRQAGLPAEGTASA